MFVLAQKTGTEPGRCHFWQRYHTRGSLSQTLVRVVQGRLGPQHQKDGNIMRKQHCLYILQNNTRIELYRKRV